MKLTNLKALSDEELLAVEGGGAYELGHFIGKLLGSAAKIIALKSLLG